MFTSAKFWILHLSRPVKRVLVLTADVLICLISTWIAFALRLDTWLDFSSAQFKVFVIAIFTAFPIFIHCGLYRAIFRFTGWPALLAMSRALIFYCILIFGIFGIYGIDGVPRSIGVLQPIFFIFGIGFNRAIIRYLLNDSNEFKQEISNQKILIIGVTLQAREYVLRLLNSPDKTIIGFIDESANLVGNTIYGVPIFSDKVLKEFLNKNYVQEIHLMKSVITKTKRDQILLLMQSYPHIRFIDHAIFEKHRNLLSDELFVNYGIDDLLERSQVTIDDGLIRKNIYQNTILITGAGGSIGSEICRQVLDHEPKTLLLIENSEHALYKIYEELNEIRSAKNLSVNIIPSIASVSNEGRMRELISSWSPNAIFHAAAYKHVSLVESNPAEAILNNVQGTLICASLAIEYRIGRFVLVSTDKAVRPTNIMGASKRLAEMVLQALGDKFKSQSGSILTMVRFGNVLGSSGSVVPLFERQIALGGPVTITHPEVTRYFMSIPEASSLVIQASILGKGGEVFLLEMGNPVKIVDLAKRLILLSGKSLKDEANPSGDIEILISGLRPGEKLYEELLIGANPTPTSHPKIMRAMEDFLSWPELEPKLNNLFDHCRSGSIDEIKSILSEIVNGYEPHPDIVDLTYLERS